MNCKTKQNFVKYNIHDEIIADSDSDESLILQQ